MRPVLLMGLLLGSCASSQRPIVAPERMDLLATCEELAAARDRGWEAAWTWDEQMTVLRDFWMAADAAGCTALGSEWEV